MIAAKYRNIDSEGPMGEIGIMMTGLNDGELNLEDLIDEEIRSAGFADLFET